MRTLFLLKMIKKILNFLHYSKWINLYVSIVIARLFIHKYCSTVWLNMFQEYEPLFVFVNNPPDISHPKLLRELDLMVEDFETLPQAIGPSATMFWVNDLRKVGGPCFVNFSSCYKHDFSLSLLMLFQFVKAFQEDSTGNDWLTAIAGDLPLSASWIPTFLTWAPFWNATLRWHWEDE